MLKTGPLFSCLCGAKKLSEKRENRRDSEAKAPRNDRRKGNLHSFVAGVDVGGDVADDGGGFAVVPEKVLHLADGA